MKRDYIDFHAVHDMHIEIHRRLLNWARWVTPGTKSWVSPMFRQCKSNAWQWHPPEFRESCDVLDAMKLEKTISTMPIKHRDTIRWAYVVCCPPSRAQRAFGLTKEGLMKHLEDGRAMLKNMLDN